MVLFLYNGRQNLPTNRKLPYTTTSALGTFLLAGQPGRSSDNLLTLGCSSESHSKAILASRARAVLARSRVSSVAFVQHNKRTSTSCVKLRSKIIVVQLYPVLPDYLWDNKVWYVYDAKAINTRLLQKHVGTPAVFTSGNKINLAFF